MTRLTGTWHGTARHVASLLAAVHTGREPSRSMLSAAFITSSMHKRASRTSHVHTWHAAVYGGCTELTYHPSPTPGPSSHPPPSPPVRLRMLPAGCKPSRRARSSSLRQKSTASRRTCTAPAARSIPVSGVAVKGRASTQAPAGGNRCCPVSALLDGPHAGAGQSILPGTLCILSPPPLDGLRANAFPLRHFGLRPAGRLFHNFLERYFLTKVGRTALARG